MNIKKFGLFVIACFLISIDFSLAQTADTVIQAINITTVPTSDQVTINYDINNPKGYTLQVSLQMKKKNDNSFKYVPKYLSGDIGEGIFQGKSKKIIWDSKRERLPLFNMDDYFFEINVKTISTNDNNNNWLWVKIGAAVVVGGTILYFILKGGKEHVMPNPPGRP
jgi:hypothetical protein